MIAPTTRKDLMIVNMGPQHPSMHGVLRLIFTLDGEYIIDYEPILVIYIEGWKKLRRIEQLKIFALCNALGLFSYYV